MNPLIPKIVGSTVAIGVLGTGAYFGSKELFREETIREKLSKESFRLIQGDDTEQWELEFKSDETNIKSELGNNITSGVFLSKECEKMLNSSIEKNITKVKKWCGIRSISEQLKRANKTFLVTDKSSDNGASWTATYAKRRSVTADRAKLGLTSSWTGSGDEGLQDIKDWCQKQENADYSKANEEKFKTVEGWCTKEGAQSEFK